MFPALLMMMTGGISLSLATCNPATVTLRWLRLGGILAGTLLGVAVVAQYGATATQVPSVGVVLGGTALAVAGQLVAVQLNCRRLQRWAAVATFPLSTHAAVMLMGGEARLAEQFGSTWPNSGTFTWHLLSAGTAGAALIAAIALTSILLGMFLMTMLLGHAYLTAGNEMTQRPFRRLVRCLAVALLARAVFSVIAAYGPWMHQRDPATPMVWTMMMVTARYAVGILVPAAFLYMIYDCVNRAANQSATGILYVTLVLVFIGEGTALLLMLNTTLPF